MAYSDYVGELTGAVPRLPRPYAGTLLNRAWRRFLDWRIWSFNIVNGGQQFVPGQITGSCTFQFGSNLITGVDSTSAALITTSQLAGPGVPPVASPVLGLGRQIRASGAVNTLLSSVGPYYNIVAWNPGTSTLTLDRPYGEGSGVGIGYQIVRAYYAAPALPPTSSPNNYDSSYIRYLCLTNPVSGYALTGRSLYLTQEALNTYDPQRGNGQGGDAYAVAFYARNSLGQAVSEFYPTPTNPATYVCVYATRWGAISPTNDFPQMPYELTDTVMEMAHYQACGWAQKNVSTFPELGQVNWVAAMGMHKGEFKEALTQAIKMDRECMPALPYLQGKRIEFPLGGQFVQSHDLTGLLGAGF